MVVQAVGFAPFLWVPFYVEAAGIPFPANGAMIALSAAGTALAGVVLGQASRRQFLSDGFRQHQGPAIGVLIVVVSTFVIGLAASWLAMWIFCLALLCHGIGVGLFNATYTGVVAATMPASDRGVAGSLAELTRTFGFASGAALLSMLLPLSKSPTLEDVLPGLERTFLVASLVLSVMLLLWRMMLRQRRAGLQP